MSKFISQENSVEMLSHIILHQEIEDAIAAGRRSSPSHVIVVWHGDDRYGPFYTTDHAALFVKEHAWKEGEYRFEVIPNPPMTEEEKATRVAKEIANS